MGPPWSFIWILWWLQALGRSNWQRQRQAEWEGVEGFWWLPQTVGAPHPPSQSPSGVGGGHGFCLVPQTQRPGQGQAIQENVSNQGLLGWTCWHRQNSSGQGGGTTSCYGGQWQAAADCMAVPRLPLPPPQPPKVRMQELRGGEAIRQGAHQLHSVQGQARASYRVQRPQHQSPPSTLSSASAKADQSKPKAPPPASAKSESAAPKGPPPLPKHGTAPPPPAKSSGTGAAEEEIAITFLQGPAASQGQATAQQLNAAVEASGDTPKDGFIEEDAEVEAVPLYIPACLNTAAVKLLIKCGVEVASKFKGHFNLKTVGPSELQQQLALARKKLQGISTLDQTLWAAEIAMAKADVAALEEKTGMAADADGLSMDQAPGVDTGVLSKLMQLLSRHQKAMAREAEEHQVLVTSLEAQVAELQLQISSAQCLHVQQTATNEELLVGLQTKVDALTMAPPPSKVSYAQASDAQSCLKQQLGKRLSAEWLASNGMTGITEQAVSALLAEFTSALREAGPGVSSTILAPAPKAATTMGERKRAFGQDECWADTAADADDDMDPC